MKKYVFDASTLLLLAKITLLRSFSEISHIIIPQKVKSEALIKKEKDDAQIIERLIGGGKIQVVKDNVPSKKIVDDFRLGEGEAEALYIAVKEKMIIATDDLRAIKASKVLDIRFITAIHCLLLLYKKKKIDRQLALEKLKSLEMYGRYNTEIIKNTRKIIEGGTDG